MAENMIHEVIAVNLTYSSSVFIVRNWHRSW